MGREECYLGGGMPNRKWLGSEGRCYQFEWTGLSVEEVYDRTTWRWTYHQTRRGRMHVGYK